MENLEFEALLETMKSTPRPLALLGAGVSVDCGYPDWNTLLELLEKKAEDKVGHKYKTFLRYLNDPAWQAEEYFRAMGEDSFRSFISNTFAYKNKIGPLLNIIVRLGFRHIITTNYDPCVEEAFNLARLPFKVVDWNQETKIRDFFLELSRTNKQPYLIYLHGRHFEPDKIILTESSYINRYVKSDDAQRKLFALLITQPVVFIGFSINDPDLNHIMREVNARLGIGNPQHYAFVGYKFEDQCKLIKNRFEGKYGIKPVFYKININEKGLEDHTELLNCLKELYKRIYNKEPNLPESALNIDQVPIHDPLDKQKGRWGGKSENNHRRLKVDKIKEGNEIYYFDLVVESTNKKIYPIKGDVEFHLHQTFDREVYSIKAKNGEARLEGCEAYGAFTVGAEIINEKTKLELDLAQVKDFAQWFRER